MAGLDPVSFYRSCSPRMPSDPCAVDRFWFHVEFPAPCIRRSVESWRSLLLCREERLRATWRFILCLYKWRCFDRRWGFIMFSNRCYELIVDLMMKSEKTSEREKIRPFDVPGWTLFPCPPFLRGRTKNYLYSWPS